MSLTSGFRNDHFRRRANSLPDGIKSITEDSRRHSQEDMIDDNTTRRYVNMNCSLSLEMPSFIWNYFSPESKDCQRVQIVPDEEQQRLVSYSPTPKSHEMSKSNSFFEDIESMDRTGELPSEAATLRLLLLRSGEARLTRIALAIVWLFIFCHAWRQVHTIICFVICKTLWFFLGWYLLCMKHCILVIPNGQSGCSMFTEFRTVLSSSTLRSTSYFTLCCKLKDLSLLLSESDSSKDLESKEESEYQKYLKSDTTSSCAKNQTESAISKMNPKLFYGE